MKIAEILKNKWVKRGLITAVITGGGLAIYGIVRKRNQMRELNNGQNDDNGQSWVLPPQTTPSSQTTPTGMSTLQYISYNRQSLNVEGKTYSFTSSGIVKIQKYLSKNAAYKKQIDASGGTDGVIGETFVTILLSVIMAAAKKVNPFTSKPQEYAHAAIQALAKASGIASGEMKVS